ncbi:MAG: hypothetical protein IT459_13400 [Planctomycetes bacterium]|nr:hypothetical protein [Planctomycetota bacterium]
MSFRTVVWVAVVAAAFALGVDRAVTWPIGHDEALTWMWYVAEPWSKSFTHFDANHHVLFTWLAKLSAATFGDDTWALRLPSMLALLVYLTACARLASRSCDSLGFALCVFAAMTLGPRTLEYSFAARGYGGALAALAVALVQLRRGSSGLAAGVALGVCVAFNLAFAWAVAGVGLAAWWIRIVDARGFLRMALLSGSIAGAICGGPLVGASPSAFYFGASGLAACADSLFVDGLRLPDQGWLLSLLTGGAPLDRFEFVRDVARIGIAAVFVGIAGRAVMRRSADHVGAADRIPGVALVVAATAAWIAHAAFDVPLPRERTALWVSVLAPLAWAELARGPGAMRQVARGLLVVVATVLPLRTVTSTYFSEWWPDLRSIETIDAIVDDAVSSRRAGAVRVGSDWRVEPSLRHAVRDRTGSILIDVARIAPGNAPLVASAAPGDDYLVLFVDQLARAAPIPGATLLRRFEGTAIVRVGPR